MTSAPDTNRRSWLIGALLVVVVLLPYLPMLTGSALPIPDDRFASDLADGEMPGRFEASRLFAAGESSTWTSRIEGGTPLAVDPLSLVLFAWLPPAVALGWFVAFLLAVASLGTYALARHLGVTLAGAFLAGLAYAWSGFIVCQLRHLTIIGTVAFVPLAVLCIEKAATGRAPNAASAAALPWHERALWLVGFAGIYGLQILYGFLQSTYYASLLYGGLVLARAAWLIRFSGRESPVATRFRPVIVLAGLCAAAVALAIVIGASELFALGEVAAISDRRSGASFEWATQWSYWPRSALTFLSPYVNGDISNGTYVGPSIFWEDYAYVGLATVVLALFAIATSWRRFGVSFWLASTVLAFVIVLGPNTPVYRVLFELVPGMGQFRLPTRMLFVVVLGLALLGGIGLTELERRVTSMLGKRKLRTQLAPLLSAIIVVGTTANLIATNARQNPFADAERWFSTPQSARMIVERGEPGRVYTPMVRDLRMAIYPEGWSGSLEPYYDHRESLQPNSNLLHGISALDGYVGISPSWVVDLIGDHNRMGFLTNLVAPGLQQRVKIHPLLFEWLGALSVRWVLFPRRLPFPVLEHLGSASPMEVYRLTTWKPRARIIERSRVFASHNALFDESLKGTFDVSRELALHDPALGFTSARITGGAGETRAGDAEIVVDRSDQVVVETRTSREAWLFLADTYYPGWVATLDGRDAHIVRANVAYRAVAVPAGTHRVTFRYEPPAFGRTLTVGASIVWALCGIAMLYVRRAKRRH
jgi:hypothetical protein